MGRQWLLACMLLSTAMSVTAYSTGAPAAACARIYPEGHNGESLSLSSNPFVLDISQLYNQLGNIYYTPGYSYTRKIFTCRLVYRADRLHEAIYDASRTGLQRLIYSPVAAVHNSL